VLLASVCVLTDLCEIGGHRRAPGCRFLGLASFAPHTCLAAAGKGGPSRVTSELSAETALDRFSLPSTAQERDRVKSLQAVERDAEAPAERDRSAVASAASRTMSRASARRNVDRRSDQPLRRFSGDIPIGIVLLSPAPERVTRAIDEDPAGG
jgi:hypothetical protein